MRFRNSLALLLCAFFICVQQGFPQTASPTAAGRQTPSTQPALPQPGIQADAVIAHLGSVIQWYRHVQTLEETPNYTGDLLLHDRTHELSLRAVQLAFDFGHATAQLQATETLQNGGVAAANTTSAARNLTQVAARSADRVNNLQAKLTALEAALGKAPGKQLAMLQAQRQELNAELNLAKEVQKTVQSLVDFAGNNGGNGSLGGGLQGQINDLERAVPEARSHSQASGIVATTSGSLSQKGAAGSTGTTSQNVSAPAKPDSEGLFALISSMFTFRGQIGQLTTLIQESDDLDKNIERVKAPLTENLRGAITRSEQIANSADSQDVSELQAGQKEIANLTTQFRGLSTALVPLNEENIMVDATRGNLVEWRASLTELYGSAGRSLLMRTGTLAILIICILVIAEVWRRAIFRYIKDTRRRRQFLVLRRVVVTVTVVLTVLLSFVTQFGSLATYAGFLTAGIALALQNVLLSVVAYFFLIGKYGVRVGDRVTVSGVTGEVIDLGLVRMYLMELAGEGTMLHSTGRVVVYANAILFQPQALFKQLPGVDYQWHGVKLTLTAQSDFKIAETKLCEAVRSVYDEYRPVIEKQHESFEKSVEVQVRNPEPQAQLRYSDSGLEFEARYPVVAQHASQTDAQVMRALYDVVSSTPQLTLASQGAPELEKVS